MKIGSGIIKSLKIPDNWKNNDICTTIYGSVIDENDNLSNRAILSGHDEDVYRLNDKILHKIHNKQKIYYSIDQADIDVDLNYPIEYLNLLRFPGFPVHDLELINLSINDGLRNGTRMKIMGLFKFNIKVEIITGTHAGNCVFIPRIILDILLAFAITVNKSQDQKFSKSWHIFSEAFIFLRSTICSIIKM